MNASSPRDMSMVSLALFSLGVATFLLAGAFMGKVDLGAFIPYGLITGAVGMIIPGILAFRAGNSFGGTIFTVVGTFFASVALYYWFFAATAKNPDTDLAWAALAWTVVIGFLALASFGVAGVPLAGSIMWVVLFIAFLFAWITGAFHVESARTIASIAGIIVAIMAWIGGFVTLRNPPA